MEKTNHTDNNGVKIFKSAALQQASDKIHHGFFGRRGGESSGIYSSLNVGVGSNDTPELVQKNRALIAQNLGVASDNLASVYQIHSATAVTITDDWDAQKWDASRPKADALVTNVKNLAIGVLSADCGPVLFVDPKAEIIGAAHSGWRGAQGGILESTIAAMVAIGATRENIIATLGPCISQASYQVGAEFLEIFCKEAADNSQFFIDSDKPDHYQFDLKAYVVKRLKKAGIQADAMPQCTYIDEDDFFSYRRTTHRSEPDYGRQLSGIALK